ncbi:MAG TPA: FAD-binding oxidoreductase [Terriglobales bacterium]|nr:FAD-binding oxidoreductase [Terriglobales bacterium]
MALITRRRLIQQTAFTAAALCAYPAHTLVEELRTLRGRKENASSLDQAAIRKLASQITGHVITPYSSDYESARQVNNHAYDRHPAVIVHCANPSDVARALAFGQSHGLPLAVRCGGHSAAGFGVCDGGVVLDLSGMKRVEVDADKRLARVQAGALVGEVDAATQRFGLATTLGACPTVGVGGLTLGGGLGTLMPKYGAACDNVQSAQIVTVDGRQIAASRGSNPDLFWAIRGGGGNFGVVTAFEYRLHPVSEILAGTLVYPAGPIPELLHAYLKVTAAAPDELNLVAMIVPGQQGPTFVILVGYSGQPDAGNALLKPLRAPLRPLRDTVNVMSYLESQASGFPPPPKPLPYFTTSLFLPQLSEPAIADITTAAKDAPQKFRVMISYLHGAVARVPYSDAAFPLRMRGYEVEVSTDWSTPAEEDSGVRWAKALRAALQPFSHGMYVNGLSEPSDELMRAAYGANYDRLVEIKKKYDPANVLHLNPNIRPA